MSVGTFLEGGVFLVVVFGSVGLLTRELLERHLAHLRGATRFLAAGLVFTWGLLAVHLLPGVLGVLNRWTVAVAAVGALLLTRLVLGSHHGPAQPPASPGKSEFSLHESVRERPWEWALAAVGAAAVLVELLGYFRTQATFPVVEGDAMNFHLPVVAQWIQTGTLWPVDNFVPYVAPGNYPQNGELAQLAVTLPWHHGELSRFAMLPFVGMMLGVRRTTVTDVMGSLQKAGLVRYRRGHVTILDVEALRLRACECYDISRLEFDRLLGDTPLAPRTDKKHRLVTEVG